MFSKKKIKGNCLKSIPDYTLFFPNSRCSLKKRSSLQTSPRFYTFTPKTKVFFKKKKKKKSSPHIGLTFLHCRSKTVVFFVRLKIVGHRAQIRWSCKVNRMDMTEYLGPKSIYFYHKISKNKQCHHAIKVIVWFI